MPTRGTSTIRIGKKETRTRERKRSLRISVRSALALIVPLLLLVTTGLVVWRMFTSATASVDELARAGFSESAKAAVASTRAQFDAARTQMRVLLGNAVLNEPEERLIRRMHVQLEANPSFSWVSFSRPDGSFCGVYRDKGEMLLNQTRIEDGVTIMETHALDTNSNFKFVRREDDTGYDPRKRPFYIAAEQQRGETWTEPYVFFSQQVPGITLAAPYYTPTGELEGVYTVDFILESLREFVTSVKVGKTGSMFITTRDGTILAHPEVDPVMKDDGGRLKTLADSGDPLLSAFAGLKPTTSLDVFVMPVDDKPWVAGTQAFSVGNNLLLFVGLAAPEIEFTGDVNRSLRDTALISAIAIGLAMAAALWFSRLISRPLTKVAEDMDRVGRLELDSDERLPAPFKEIQVMTFSLEGMKAGLRSFAGYVPKQLVQELMAEGRPAQLEAEYRNMTVFFSDVEGFTTLAEKLKPADLVQLLAAYLGELTHEIVDSGGTVDKFLGDGVMAFWNAPNPVADHALRATRAAMQCRARIERLAQDPDTRAYAFNTRIGIATGEMLVGNFGTSDRMNYTVMGDVANVAARLEGLSKLYGTHVLVNDATAKAVGDRIVFRPVDLVAVKGRHEGGMVYEPLCEAGDPAEQSARAAARHAESAFELYRRRDFAGAMEAFKACGDLLPGDQAAAVLAERCTQLLQSPPGPGWNGVFVANFK